MPIIPKLLFALYSDLSLYRPTTQVEALTVQRGLRRTTVYIHLVISIGVSSSATLSSASEDTAPPQIRRRQAGK